MKNFMKEDFVIYRMGFCGYVHEGMRRNSKYNRGNYALVVNVSTESKTYDFIGGQSIVVEPNSVLFLPFGSSYVTKTFPTGPFYLLEFMIEGNPEFKPFAFTPKNPSKLLADCATAVKLHKRKNIAYQMQIMSILYNIIASIQIEYNIKYISKDAGAIIMPAIEYIHSNYTKKQFDIGSLAKMCKISEDYFRKIFKEAYNVNPYEYRKRRVSRND